MPTLLKIEPPSRARLLSESWMQHHVTIQHRWVHALPMEITISIARSLVPPCPIMLTFNVRILFYVTP